jgi:hypothetical protein
VGDRTGGGEWSVSGKGAPVVGVFGSADDEHISALGLIFAPIPVVPADPPPAPPRPAPAKVERPTERRANAPQVAKPVVAPADPEKAEQPDQPDKAPPDDDDAPETKAAPDSLSWLPIAIFGAVTVPIFVLLLVSFSRKTPEPPPYRGLKKEELTKKSPAPLPAPPAVSSRPASTAFCERVDLVQQPCQEEEDIPEVLPVEPEQKEDIPEVLPDEPKPRQDDSTDDEWDYYMPLERVYYHTVCGKPTKVSGDDYVRLECAFRPLDGTFCCHCARFVSLDAVRWADTDEKITDYRQRIWDAVSIWERIWLSVFCNAYQGALNLNLDASGHRRRHRTRPKI